MRERVGKVLALVWIVAGLVVVLSFELSGRWNQRTPLWWWILAVSVVVPGLVLFGYGRGVRSHEGRWLSWWRDLPLPLRPLGVWATFMNIVAFGVVLPVFGVLFLVEGDVAGKLVGAGLLLVCLLDLWQMFRRGSSAGRRPR